MADPQCMFTRWMENERLFGMKCMKTITDCLIGSCFINMNLNVCSSVDKLTLSLQQKKRKEKEKVHFSVHVLYRKENHFHDTWVSQHENRTDLAQTAHSSVIGVMWSVRTYTLFINVIFSWEMQIISNGTHGHHELNISNFMLVISDHFL